MQSSTWWVHSLMDSHQSSLLLPMTRKNRDAFGVILKFSRVFAVTVNTQLLESRKIGHTLQFQPNFSEIEANEAACAAPMQGLGDTYAGAPTTTIASLETSWSSGTYPTF